MGQQQLLLLTLAAILVGIGVLLGINMFQENAAQANMDAVIQRCLTLGSQAQAWYKRPTAMGGGGQDFTGFDLQSLGFSADSDTTEDGVFTSAVVGPTSITITGTGKEDLDGDTNPVEVIVTVSSNSASVTSVDK
jgi:hypothetical protein